MSTFTRSGLTRTVRRTINAATAAEMVGLVAPGCEISWVSKGQVPPSRLVGHLAEQVGPADVTISTWGAAPEDIAFLHELLVAGKIRSCRWLVDTGYPTREPDEWRCLVERFGGEAVRRSANHSKFVLLLNEAWNLVVRTSQSLAMVHRLEFFDLSDDATLARWFADMAQAMFDAGAESPEIDTADPPIQCEISFTGHGQVRHG